MNSIFEELKNISKPGVFILKDPSDKSCYIGYSSNIAGALNRLLGSKLFIPEYEFNILEIVTNPINLRIKCQYYKDKYSNNGYNLINPERVSKLKLSIDPIRDFRSGHINEYLLSVKIVSKGYKELIVGLFNDYSEVSLFLESYYPGKIVTEVIYSNNGLTKEYLKNG